MVDGKFISFERNAAYREDDTVVPLLRRKSIDIRTNWLEGREQVADGEREDDRAQGPNQQPTQRTSYLAATHYASLNDVDLIAFSDKVFDTLDRFQPTGVIVSKRRREERLILCGPESKRQLAGREH